MDWLSICPPTGTGVKIQSDDLLQTPLDQPEIDFENEGGETYICGNPPYLGARDQKFDQKDDLRALFDHRVQNWKSLDYVAGWFIKAADYGAVSPSAAAFVATNSVCQGVQVAVLWPLVFDTKNQISFAYPSFKWANLASNNAGVTVVIVGISTQPRSPRRIFSIDRSGQTEERQCSMINAYLSAGENIIVSKASQPIGPQSEMTFGNTPIDGGHLLMSRDELDALALRPDQRDRFVRRIYGSAEFIRGLERYCLWIRDEDYSDAVSNPLIAARIQNVRNLRREGGVTAKDIADRPHQMQRMNIGNSHTIIVAAISSENRPYLPCGLLDNGSTITNKNYALFDAPLWNMALLASRLHWVWIGTVCVRMRTDFSYSNTLGWNTFPLTALTEKNKSDLTKCAEDILLAREAHFPKTIADLYDPDEMPDDLRTAHDRNDEVLERIFIGRRFRNDTERLEKLFELYTKMTSAQAAGKTGKRTRA